MSRSSTLLLLACTCAMSLFSGGCALFGLIAYTLTPPTVDARYEPPKTPMLVLVENRQNPGMFVAEADELTSYIIDDLAAYKVGPIVDRQKLEALRDSRNDISKLTISQVGREVGAKQVLYVDLRRINIGRTIEGVPTHGRIDAMVHVVDVDSGRTTFPQIGEAWPIDYETSLAHDVNGPDPTLVRSALTRATGTTIGRLFHDYIP